MWIFNQPSGIEIIKRPRQVAVGDTKHPAALFTLYLVLVVVGWRAWLATWRRPA